MGKKERGYQYDFASLYAGKMYDVGSRKMKAGKTIAVLTDCLGKLGKLRHVDLGCSTGMMTRLYAEHFRTSIGVDIDEKAVRFAKSQKGKKPVKFIVGDAMNTGLPDSSADVVTCSQVYEHVPDARKMIDEIYRILVPGGVCYFAAANRLVWLEAHYELPLLSVMPKFMAHLYLKILKRGDFYYETHFTYWTLKKLVKKFKVTDYTRKVIEDPVKFSATDLTMPGSLKQKMALTLLAVAYWLSPTYIWILKKPI